MNDAYNDLTAKLRNLSEAELTQYTQEVNVLKAGSEPAPLSAKEASLLAHYSLDKPWVFDAMSILEEMIWPLAERGLLVAANPEGHGHYLTEAGAAALAAYTKNV